MLILEDNFTNKIKENTCIALGSFDGVHMGHLALMDATKKISKELNCKSMVYNYKNHPLTVINKELAPKLLISNDDKTKLLESYGLDIVNYVDFNREHMKLSPEEFVNNLLEFYNAKAIIVGFNHRFGYKNLGDTQLLKKLSLEKNFKLVIVEAITFQNEVVSSSKIRSILMDDGDVNLASKLLTRYYSIKGEVIHGKKLGRTLGFPTINLSSNYKYVIPRGGVYHTLVEYEGKLYNGITNIGYNPTVENGNLIKIETNILDFNKEIYGERVKIYFVDRIRDEKKFDSVEELKRQLKEDKLYIIYKNENI